MMVLFTFKAWAKAHSEVTSPAKRAIVGESVRLRSICLINVYEKVCVSSRKCQKHAKNDAHESLRI